MVCQLTFIFKPVKTWREGFWSIEVEVSRGLMVTTFLPKVIFNPEPVGTFSDYGHEDWLKYGQILILLARTPGWLLASLGPAGLESEPCDDSDICSKNSTKDMWTSETVLKPPRTHSSTAMHLQRVAKKNTWTLATGIGILGYSSKDISKKSASPQKRSAQLMFLPE